MPVAWLGVVLAVGLGVELPVIGAPLEPEVAEHLRALPNVASAEVGDSAFRLTLVPGRELSYNDVVRTLREHTVATEIDADRIPLGRHTIFQVDAGQCFHCTEQPMRTRLSRKEWIERWAVVGYAPQGRMHFRVEPKRPTPLEALGAMPYEDILFTDRYDGVDEAFHDWPTGGVAWRASEEEARKDATASKKPLFFFPTAGT